MWLKRTNAAASGGVQGELFSLPVPPEAAHREAVAAYESMHAKTQDPDAQAAASDQVPAMLMAGYIAYLASDGAPAPASAEFELAMPQGIHRRSPRNLQSLWRGILGLLGYLAASDVPAAQIEAFRRGMLDGLAELAADQAAAEGEADYVERFFEILRALLDGGEARFEGRHAYGDGPGADGATGKTIGWIDGEVLFLDAELADGLARQYASRTGRPLVPTKGQLLRLLAEKGLLLERDLTRSTHTVRKQLGGRSRNVLCLSLDVVLGESSTGKCGDKPDKPDDPGPGMSEMSGLSPASVATQVWGRF